MHKDGVVQQIARLMKVEKDAKIRLSCIRCETHGSDFFHLAYVHRDSAFI